jgi:hypothetical protein
MSGRRLARQARPSAARHGMTRRGMAWQARRGPECHSNASIGLARLGRHGGVRIGLGWQGEIWRGRLGEVWRVEAGFVGDWPSVARQAR